MGADSRPRPNPETRYELLYRLMVIAAIAVIVVSLVGIASVTGLLPRVGVHKPNADAAPAKERSEARSPAGGRTPHQHPRLERRSNERRYAVAVCASCRPILEPRSPTSFARGGSGTWT